MWTMWIKKKIQQIPSRNKKTIQTDANFRLEILNHHLLLEVENFLRILIETKQMFFVF